MRWKSIAIFALLVSLVHLLPHVHQRRAAGSHDTSIGRLKTVARLSTGIYLTRELIKGDHVDEIVSELLKMGDAKASDVVAMNEADILNAVNSMKDMQIKTSSGVDMIENKLKVLAETQENVKSVADVAVWNGKAAFESAVNGIKDNFAPVKAFMGFKTKANEWELYIQKVIDKDPSAISSNVDDLKTATKDIIDHINAMSQDSVKFSSTGTAVESFSQPAGTAALVKQIQLLSSSWNTVDVADFEDNAKALFTVGTSLRPILSQLRTIETIQRLRTPGSGSRGLVHTDGMFQGSEDLTALASDFNDPWLSGISNSSTHLEKAMTGLKTLSFPMKDYSNRVGVPTEVQLATIRSLIEKVELVVKASEKPQETLSAAATARDCDKDNGIPRGFDKVLAVADLTKKLDQQLAYLKMSLQRMSEVIQQKNVVSLLQSVHDKCKQMTDMTDLKNVIKNEFDGDKLRNPLKNLANNNNIDGSVLTTTAQSIAANLQDVAVFYTDMANFKKIFNCAKPIQHLDLVGKAVSAIQSARSPPGTLFADSAPIIQKVTGANSELRSVQSVANGLKGKKSKESDALDLLTDPQSTSATIGKAVHAVVMADEAEQKTSEMGKVIDHLDSIGADLSQAVGLSPEDVLNLQKLVNLKNKFEVLKGALSTWKSTVSAEQFGQLGDGSKFTTPTKQLQGVQADLAPLIRSLEKLIAAAPNSPNLVLLKDSLKSLATLHLDFSTYTSSLDAAADSLAGLETFFASFAQQNFAPDAPTVAPPTQRRNDGKGNVGDGSNAVSGKKESATTENDTSIVVLGVGGGVVVIVLATTGFFVWLCCWKKKKAPADDKDDDDEKDTEKKEKEEIERMKADKENERKEKEEAVKKQKDLEERMAKEKKEADRKIEEADKKREEAEKGKKEAEEKEQKERKEKEAVKNDLDAEVKKNADLAVKMLVDQYKKTEVSKKVKSKEAPPVAMKPVTPTEKSMMVDKTQDSSRISKTTVPMNVLIASITCLWDTMLNTNAESPDLHPYYEAMCISAMCIAEENQPTAHEKRLFNKHATKIRADVRILMVSRVLLANWQGEPDDDFIHFSRVRFSNGLRFLAGQSPQEANAKLRMADTMMRTWHMIRQERPGTIVMFGKMTVDKDVLCAPYFPEDVNQVMGLDGVVIRCTSRVEERKGEVIVRKLHVQFTKHKTDCELTHYQYVAWNEKVCPLDTSTMIWLLKQVNREEQQVVVHCPDGVSATGIFCYIEMAVQHMVEDEQLNFMQVLLMLRQRRFGAIRVSAQLEFAVLASLDYAADKRDLPEEPKTRMDCFHEAYRVCSEMRATKRAGLLAFVDNVKKRAPQVRVRPEDSIKAAKKRYGLPVDM